MGNNKNKMTENDMRMVFV